MVTVEYQTVVERAMTRAGTKSTSSGKMPPAPHVEQGAQLVVLGLRRQLLGDGRPQGLDLLLQTLVLALGAEKVGDPVPAVAQRLDRPRAALLEGGDDAQRSVLHPVHEPVVRLAEVQGQQGQRQQHEHRGDEAPLQDTPAIHLGGELWPSGLAAGSCACS